MSRYLVTGGAGFIGSHIAESLTKRNEVVRVLDNFSSGKEDNLKGFIDKVEVWKADIRDKDACLKATEGIDFILHQAALRSVPKSLESPHEYNAVNITGTLNLLEAALKNKVKTFVLASTCAIYGDPDRFPEKESFSPLLISPYALTKLAGEYYCRVFTKNYGLNTVALRYFNVFGPRQSLDDEYSVVIPKFINCMLNDQQPPIHGTGKQSRDFVYVENIVQANLAACLKASIAGEVFNVAMGRDYSILELVKLLNEIMSKRIKPQFTPARQGDVFKALGDISKSKRLLGFRPNISFKEGLRQTVEWFKA